MINDIIDYFVSIGYSFDEAIFVYNKYSLANKLFDLYEYAVTKKNLNEVFK